MSKLTIILKDDNGKDYTVENILNFQKHLHKFHPVDISIHEENGHYFRVDDTFRDKIDELAKNASK